MQETGIVNKVAQSGIITLDLEDLIPELEIAEIDIKDQLFQGLMLREKDFRSWIKEHNWDIYAEKLVAVHCSVDAIVPTWAYMLISSALRGVTSQVYFSAPKEVKALLVERTLGAFDISIYENKRVVIKGCGDREISNHAYVRLTEMLAPSVLSIMYGEPCSTVPVYKRRKTKR